MSSLVLVVQVVFAIFPALIPSPTMAATITWDGGGTDGTCGGAGTGDNWSCGLNWSTNTVPTGADIATFNATSTKSADLDTAQAPAGVNIATGYTGTITQNAALTVGGSNFVQADGFFAGGTTTIDLNGSFTLSGSADFTATSGTMFVSGAWTNTGTGVFHHNSGTVTFDGSTGSTINVNATEAFNNVTINKTVATVGLNVSFNDNLTVAGTATLTNGELQGTSGTMEIDNAVSIAIGFDGGNGQLKINSGIALTPANGAILPGVYLFHASSTLTAPGLGTTITFEGRVQTDPGTFTAGAGTVVFQNNLTIGSGISFVPSTGTVSFTGASTSIIDLPGTFALNNLTLAKNNNVGANLVIGDTLQVPGLLTLTDGQFNSSGTAGTGNGIIEQNGTFSYSSAFDGGSGEIVFNTLQVIAVPSARPFSGFRLNVTGSSVTLVDNQTIGGEVILTTGTTFTAGTGATVLSRSLTVPSGATFVNNGGTVYWANVGNYTHVISGTLTFNNMSWGDGNLNIGVSGNNQGLTFPAGVTTTISGYLQLFLASSNPPPNLDLRSSTPGIPAVVVIVGTNNRFADLDVQDIDNESAFVISCLVRCIDSGNNTNWIIGSPAIRVGAISGDTTEAGGTASFSVVLDGQPTATVTVPIASSDTGEGTVSASSLVFTAGNYDTPQSVLVTGVDDALVDGGVTYDVTVGPASSADGRYDTQDPPDVTVVNDDDDTPTDGLSFTDSADFDVEDVKDSAGTPIVNWEHNYYGHIFLEDSGFVSVDITSSKIKAGCKIDLSGTVYTITRVWFDSVTGDITVQDQNGSTPLEEDTLLPASGTVNSIICTDTDASGQRLHSEFINSASVASDPTGYQIRYDAADDVIWSDDSAIQRLDLGTLTETSIPRQSGFEPGIGIDTLRDRIWYANYGSDTITVVTGAGAYVNGTLAASSFATCDGPESATYDSVNDKMWVICGDTLAVDAHNPSTGAVLSSTSIGTGGSFSSRGLIYDPVENVVWAVSDDGKDTVELNATNGAYKNGTLANSTFWNYLTSPTFGNVRSPVYDAASGQVYIQDAQCDVDTNDYIMRMDPATGQILSGTGIPSCPVDMFQDPVTGNLLVTSDHQGSISEIDPATGILQAVHQGMDPSYGVTVDGDGDIWTAEYNNAFHEWVRDGVPAKGFYTELTNASGALDSSTWTSIDSVTPDETLDGGNIYYTVSFDDRHTYNAWGSWRPIASDKASVHGGTDGVWYYRDNASTWTVAQANNAQRAISQAVAQGANNQTTGAILSGLTTADWSSAGGFDPSVNTVNFGVTYNTDDAHNSPQLRSMAVAKSSAGIYITPLSGTTGEDGTAAFFDVVLTSAPSAPVTIPISSSDTSEGTLNGSSVNFSTLDWNIPRTVQADGVDDALDDGDISYTAITDPAVSTDPGYSGLDGDDVSLLNLDNDALPIFSGTIPDQSWDEDTSLTAPFDLDDYFTDTGGLGMTYTVAAGDTPSSNFVVTINLDGTVDFSSVANFFGTDTVTFTATNSVGSTDTNQINLTVNSVNDIPEPPTTGFTPANDDVTSDLTPTISWDAGSDVEDANAALVYNVRFGTDPDPETTFSQSFTTNPGETQVQITSDLADGTDYYYVVQTVDTDAAGSAWSTAQHFSTSTAATPTISLTKKVGVNLTAMEPPTLRAAFFYFPLLSTASAAELYGLPGGDALHIAAAIIQLSVIFLVIVFAYAFAYVKKPKHMILFLARAPQHSFTHISHRNTKGTYQTSYARHKIKTRIAQIGLALALLALAVSVAIFGFIRAGMSFSDQSGNAVEPGDFLTYEIDYSNTGTGDATNAQITDVVPDGTALVSGSLSINGSPAADPNDGVTPTFDLGSVGNGTDGNVRFSVQVDSPATEPSVESPGAEFTSNETSATSNAVSNPIETSSISGSVLDSVSGDPVADVSLELLSGSVVVDTTTSATDGVYAFAGLHSGDYVVRATAPAGYDQPGDLSVSVNPGEDKTDQDIFLTPSTTPVGTSSISGSVLDSVTRDPIADVALDLLSGSTVIDSTTSASTGSYAFTDLAGGDYTIHATAPSGYEQPDDLAVTVADDEDKTGQDILLTPSAEPPVVTPIPEEPTPTGTNGGTPTPTGTTEEPTEQPTEEPTGPTEEPPIDLAGALYDAFVLDLVNGIAVDRTVPVELPTFDLIPGDTIELQGHANGGDSVKIHLCSVNHSETYTAPVNEQGVWKIRVPKSSVENGKTTVTGVVTHLDVTTKEKVLGSYVKVREKPSGILWLVLVNLFVIMVVFLVLVFVRWYRSDPLPMADIKRRRPRLIIQAVLAGIAAAIIAYVLIQSLIQTHSSSEINFTSKVEIPSLHITDVNGQPVHVDEPELIDAQDLAIIHGTGVPGAHLSISVCPGVEAYGAEIAADGSWQLSIPVDEIPDVEMVYSASLIKDGSVILPETKFFAAQVTAFISGLSWWLIIALILAFTVCATVFESSVLYLFAPQRKLGAPELPPAPPSNPVQPNS